MADISSFIITFREALEAMLILGTVVSYLAATKQQKMLKHVYRGALMGFALSVIAALAFTFFIGEFKGLGEQLFEGTTLIIGALLVSLLVTWIIKTRHGIKGVGEGVLAKIKVMEAKSVFFISLVVVLREGIEAVLFLGALSIESGALAIGAAIGIAIGIIIGYLIFKQLIKIDLAKMFAVISALLVLFAAGMVLHAVGEFQEAKVLPFQEEKAYNIQFQQNLDGSYPLLSDKGLIGGLAHDLFDYEPNPTILQVIGYFSYLGIMGVILIRPKPKTSRAGAAS
jgi:high-affinity iron transporter